MQQTIKKKLTIKNEYIKLLVYIVGFGLMGIVTLYISRAATTPGFTFEPETAIVSTPASVGTDINASNGQYIKFNSSTQSSTVWPDASNTGYRNAPGYTVLRTCTTPIVSNTSYSFCDFNGGVDVGSSATPVSNVTFIGCRFHGVSVGGKLVGLYGTNITFNYSSFEPGVTAPPVPYNQSYQYGLAANGGYGTFVHGLTVSHSDFWGFGNAIDVEGSTQANPYVFTDNWIHDASDDNNATYHTDGIGDESGNGKSSYVTINHNTIESAGNTNGLAFQQGVYDHFSITNNLFGGFGFTVAIWSNLGSHDITFTDNTYSTKLLPVWGPLYGGQNFWTTSGSTWRRNKWLVPSGAAWGNPLHSGWYWLPVTDSTTGASDSSFVSQTDFGG